MKSRDWALDLWDHGYQVVLVPLKGKHPKISWAKYQKERVNRETVEEWYRHGEHNLAIITGAISGVVVVDGDSAEACQYIELTCGATPMRVRTSKGRHYYFRHPGGRVPNSVRVLDDPPVDLRGDGGLVIGPGSVHPSGSTYLLEGDLLAAAELPVYHRTWFPQADQAPEKSFHRPAIRLQTVAQQQAMEQARRYLRGVPGAVQGAGGDQHTYVQACRLVRGFDLSDGEALDLLLEWNSRCAPPWDPDDLAAKIRHARAYGSGEPGAMFIRGKGHQHPAFLSFGWL